MEWEDHIAQITCVFGCFVLMAGILFLDLEIIPILKSRKGISRTTRYGCLSLVLASLAVFILVYTILSLVSHPEIRCSLVDGTCFKNANPFNPTFYLIAAGISVVASVWVGIYWLVGAGVKDAP